MILSRRRTLIFFSGGECFVLTWLKRLSGNGSNDINLVILVVISILDLRKIYVRFLLSHSFFLSKSEFNS